MYCDCYCYQKYTTTTTTIRPEYRPCKASALTRCMGSSLISRPSFVITRWSRIRSRPDAMHASARTAANSSSKHRINAASSFAVIIPTTAMYWTDNPWSRHKTRDGFSLAGALFGKYLGTLLCLNTVAQLPDCLHAQSCYHRHVTCRHHTRDCLGCKSGALQMLSYKCSHTCKHTRATASR